MRIRVVLRLIGGILRIYAAAFLGPIAVALIYRELWDMAGFAVAAALALGLGLAASRASSHLPADFRRSEGLVVVSATWLGIAVLSAVPFVWSGLGPIDALFEAMSGVTASGGTVLVDFGRHGRALFFWRSLTQWIGGLGVIALFVAVLPRLAIAGRELFFAEAPGPTDEKFTPQLRQTAAGLWRLYAGLSAVQVLALLATGMGLYDSLCHTFATIGAGGFSPHPQSLVGYRNPAAEWVITAFMFIAGANFALQYRALRGERRVLITDEEFRVYTGIVIVASALVAVFLWRADVPAAAAIRHGCFQVVSILTTTGFAAADYARWPDGAQMVLLALMFVGGCAGSAGGGPKVVRHILVARFTILELARTLHPRAVLPVKLGGRVVPDHVMRAVVVFLLFYLLIFAAIAGALALLGADIMTAITATIASLGNVGPGMSSVGPMGNFAHLHPVSKLLLTFAMWVGRLELITVLAVLQPQLWRSAMWRQAPVSRGA
jgi:trk system potassium uptake protein TrkH